jgi:hypothetical protein
MTGTQVVDTVIILLVLWAIWYQWRLWRMVRSKSFAVFGFAMVWLLTYRTGLVWWPEIQRYRLVLVFYILAVLFGYLLHRDVLRILKNGTVTKEKNGTTVHVIVEAPVVVVEKPKPADE